MPDFTSRMEMAAQLNLGFRYTTNDIYIYVFMRVAAPAACGVPKPGIEPQPLQKQRHVGRL